jgi:glycosyltransferase involved in cell wall biosynthesis
MGHHVDVLSFNNLKGPPSRQKRFKFPTYVGTKLLFSKPYDVYDLSSGDGLIFNALRRIAGSRFKSSITLARSHGLEHLTHEAYIGIGEKFSKLYQLYNGGYRLWECRQTYAKSDAALFLNNTELDYAVHKLGVKPDRAYLVRNGVSDAFIAQANMLAGKDVNVANRNKLAFVGRYHPLKGTRLLANVMSKVLAKYPETTFSLFGTGSTSQEILADYSPQYHTRIKVTERYSNDDLPALLTGHGILVFTSISEGFGIAILEAMACGLVPIAVNFQGPANIIEHGISGFINAPTAGAFTSAVERLLDDVATWQTMRENAIKQVLRYSWPTIAQEMIGIYKEVLGRRS